MSETEGNTNEDSTDEYHEATVEPFLREEDDAICSFNNDMTDGGKTINTSLMNIHEEANTDSKFNDVDRGWAWVVLVGCFGTFCMMGSTQFAAGIIHMILLDKYNSSVSMVSVAGAVHVSMISLGAPISTLVLEHFSCRTAIVSSGCLFFVGLLATAFAPNIECVIFTYGIVAGFGGALGYTANMVVVGFYFQRKINLAMGIAVAGAGFGMCVLSQLMLYINTRYGSFGFFLLLSGIFAQIIVFGMLSKPSQLEMYTKFRQKEQSIAGKHSINAICNIVRIYWTVLANKAILLLSIGMFKLSLSTFLIFMHFPHFVVEMGFSPSVAADFISLSGILTIVGRILTGTLASVKWIRVDILYCCPILIFGIITIVYPYISSTYAGNLTYTIILGLLYGNVYVLTASVSIQHIGIVNLAKAIGIQYFFAGLGALLGPIIAGVILDAGGSFNDAFFAAGAFLLLAGITSGMSACVSRPDSGKTNIDSPDL